MSILMSCLKSFAKSMDDFKRKKKLCIYTTPALQFSTSCHVCNALPGSPAHKTCCLCLTARSPVTGSRLFYFLNLCLPEPLLAVPSILPFIHSFIRHLLDGISFGETGGYGPVAGGPVSSDNGREKRVVQSFSKGIRQGTWGLEGFLEWEDAQPRAAGCAGGGQVS